MRSERCGSVTFSKLTFDNPGIYNYTIKEITPDSGGWKTDKRVYRVVIIVEYDGKGELIARVEYLDGQPVFVNKCCKCGKCCFCSCCFCGCCKNCRK